MGVPAVQPCLEIGVSVIAAHLNGVNAISGRVSATAQLDGYHRVSQVGHVDDCGFMIHITPLFLLRVVWHHPVFEDVVLLILLVGVHLNVPHHTTFVTDVEEQGFRW